MRRENLLDFFQDFAELKGDFLVYDDGFRPRVYTYSETASLARAFAAHLRSQGVSKDQKVIFYSENRPEWVVAWWGCLLAGVVAVPIDFRSSAEFVTRIQSIVDAKLILTGDEVSFPPGENVWPLSQVSGSEIGHRSACHFPVTADNPLTPGGEANAAVIA